MGKMKDKVLETEAVAKEAARENPQPNFTHTAISMCYVPAEGWCLVKVKYDPVTGLTSAVEKSYTGEGKDYIIERLKISLVTDGIFNNSNQNY